MSLIRKAAVAGMFYPDSPEALRNTVCAHLENIDTSGSTSTCPKALIVPHAGYIYSGAAAAAGFAQLIPHKKNIKRVVLLGPSHRIGFRGLAISNAKFFQTPLGNIEIDREAIQELQYLPQISILEQAHQLEHSLEVQLPFLQQTLDSFALTPIVVGDADKESVSEVLETVWGGKETLVVISSDLSHFLSYQEAQKCDKRTCAAIEELTPDAIGHDDACGSNPIKGLLVSAKKHQLTPTTVALCNSGDTAGDKNRVVGYGTWAFR